MIKQVALFGSFALFGAGCVIPGTLAPVAPVAVPVPVKNAAPVATAPVCPTTTPQVYYFNKLSFTAAELAEIQSNVVTPVLAYYRSLAGGFRVASIMIKRATTGIVVDVIVDQPSSDEPSYQSFLHVRGADGHFPVWVPEILPPGYSG